MLTSDDLRNIRDHSRNSMDVSHTCANRTLRESSVFPFRVYNRCECYADYTVHCHL